MVTTTREMNELKMKQEINTNTVNKIILENMEMSRRLIKLENR